MIVCGDMNLDISSRNRLTQSYLNRIEANNFNIKPLEATRVTLSSKTCLDHFIYQNLFNEKVEVLEMQGNNADHYPVKIMLSAKIERENTRKIFCDISFTKSPGLVLEYKKPLLQHIQANEDLIYQNNCPCSAFSEFSWLFREVTDSFAPIRNAKKKSKMPLWFNKRLKNLRSKRDEAHSKWKREKENTNLLEQFRNRRHLLEQEIKMAKRFFYLKKFNSGLGNSRKTFKLLNELKGKSLNSTNIPLLSSSFNNKIEPTDEDNANLFNKFFATIGYNINKHLKKPFTPNFLAEETSVFFLPGNWNGSNGNCGAAGQQIYVRRWSNK